MTLSRTCDPALESPGEFFRRAAIAELEGQGELEAMAEIWANLLSVNCELRERCVEEYAELRPGATVPPELADRFLKFQARIDEILAEMGLSRDITNRPFPGRKERGKN